MDSSFTNILYKSRQTQLWGGGGGGQIVLENLDTDSLRFERRIYRLYFLATLTDDQIQKLSTEVCYNRKCILIKQYDELDPKNLEILDQLRKAPSHNHGDERTCFLKKLQIVDDFLDTLRKDSISISSFKQLEDTGIEDGRLCTLTHLPCRLFRHHGDF